jgi:multidrug resistance protein, MATE family
MRPTLALAAPIVIGQVSQIAMNVTDSVMIGHVGTVPLAASAFAGTVFGLFFVLGIGLLAPVAVLVSHARGADDAERSRRLLKHGVGLAFGFSVLEVLVMAVVGTQLHRFGQPPEVVATVGPYFLIIAFSLIPTLVFHVLRQYAESQGHPWWPMSIMTGTLLLNVVLNWVLIYGHWGFPALGLTGAGWATLIARLAGVVAIAWWLWRSGALASYWPGRWLHGHSRALYAEILKLGVPASGQLLFECGAFTAAALIVGFLGAVPLAAHQIALSCAATTFMFTLGLSTAASMRVGQAAGAGASDRVRAIGFGALLIGVVVMTAFALVFVFAGEWLAERFVDDRPVVALAAQLLVVAAIFQVFDGAQVIGAGILRGLKDVRIPTIITFVAYWMIALPTGYLLGIRWGYGAYGVWVSLALGLGFAGVFLGLRFAYLTRLRAP